MKKKIIATITMLCLLTVLYNYLRLPDYHITNSISFSSADTRDTELTVIVYKCWGIDGVIKDIENEHNKINGTPTTLEINLYYPTYYLHNNSKPFRTVTIEFHFLSNSIKKNNITTHHLCCLLSFSTYHHYSFAVRIFQRLTFRRMPRATVPNRAAGRLGKWSAEKHFLLNDIFNV